MTARIKDKPTSIGQVREIRTASKMIKVQVSKYYERESTAGYYYWQTVDMSFEEAVEYTLYIKKFGGPTVLRSLLMKEIVEVDLMHPLELPNGRIELTFYKTVKVPIGWRVAVEGNEDDFIIAKKV